MAVTVIVDGKAEIKTGTGTAAALESLGFSESGVEITEQAFMYDVHGDEQGGDVGPPIDIQYMGEVHAIRATMTKYDETVLNKIRVRLRGGTVGRTGTPGSLLFAGNLFYRLLINSVLRPRNYPKVVFREAFEVNKGTKHSKAVVIAHAYTTMGVSQNDLYNSTIV